jgi:hypothetical protein
VYAPRDLHFPETGDNGVVKAFDVPGWLELRGAHPDVTSPIPLKAAFALFLTQKTGHTHAMFAQVESERRRWPFLPKSLGKSHAPFYASLLCVLDDPALTSR